MSRTDTIQKLTYDDFGHIIGNNRSGTAGDMSYAYNGNGALTMDLNKGIYFSLDQCLKLNKESYGQKL